jgi:hypothetical protein
MRASVALIAACLSLAGSIAHAASTIVSVDGTDQPWSYVDGGLNTGFQFGVDDGTAPTTVSSFIVAGTTISIQYLDGLTSAFGPPPSVDGDGYVGSVFKNAEPGSTGTFFPSIHMDFSLQDIFLQALVGTFADATGTIVDSPFAVRNGPLEIVVPTGATQLLLGMNDDLFEDNVGALRVLVAEVPEPATLVLLGAGLLGLGLRRRLTPR